MPSTEPKVSEKKKIAEKIKEREKLQKKKQEEIKKRVRLFPAERRQERKLFLLHATRGNQGRNPEKETRG